MAAGMTRATEGWWSQWVLFASWKKWRQIAGVLSRKLKPGSFMDNGSSPPHQGLLVVSSSKTNTEGGVIHPLSTCFQRLCLWRKEEMQVLQVCPDSRKDREGGFSWPLARRTRNTALTLTTEDHGIVDKHGPTHEITHLYAYIILKFLPQWIGYYYS